MANRRRGATVGLLRATRARACVVAASLAALFVGSSGCGALSSAWRRGGSSSVMPLAPQVSLAHVALVAHPLPEHVLATLCPRALPALVCAVAFPNVPPRDRLAFVFDTTIRVANPNRFAVPVIEALIAFTAFPDDNARALGSVCASLGSGAPPPGDRNEGGPCSSTDPLVRSERDFVHASLRLLTRVALGQQRLEDIRVPTVGANGSIDTTIRLSVDVDTMLDLLYRVLERSFRDIERGVRPALVIPYALEGSTWIRVDGFGRLGATFPRATGAWDLAQTIDPRAEPSSSR